MQRNRPQRFGNGGKTGRDANGAKHHTAGAGQAFAIVMVPARCALIGEMMVCVRGPMIVGVTIGMRMRDRQHIVRETRRGSDAERERHRRRDDADEVDRRSDPSSHQPS
jgi:hypothetical protein